MTKYKKIILGLASIASVTAPIAAVVSCGKEKAKNVVAKTTQDKSKEGNQQSGSNAETIIPVAINTEMRTNLDSFSRAISTISKEIVGGNKEMKVDKVEVVDGGLNTLLTMNEVSRKRAATHKTQVKIKINNATGKVVDVKKDGQEVENLAEVKAKLDAEISKTQVMAKIVQEIKAEVATTPELGINIPAPVVHSQTAEELLIAQAKARGEYQETIESSQPQMGGFEWPNWDHHDGETPRPTDIDPMITPAIDSNLVEKDADHFPTYTAYSGTVEGFGWGMHEHYAPVPTHHDRETPVATDIDPVNRPTAFIDSTLAKASSEVRSLMAQQENLVDLLNTNRDLNTELVDNALKANQSILDNIDLISNDAADELKGLVDMLTTVANHLTMETFNKDGKDFMTGEGEKIFTPTPVAHDPVVKPKKREDLAPQIDVQKIKQDIYVRPTIFDEAKHVIIPTIENPHTDITAKPEIKLDYSEELDGDNNMSWESGYTNIELENQYKNIDWGITPQLITEKIKKDTNIKPELKTAARNNAYIGNIVGRVNYILNMLYPSFNSEQKDEFDGDILTAKKIIDDLNRNRADAITRAQFILDKFTQLIFNKLDGKYEMELKSHTWTAMTWSLIEKSQNEIEKIDGNLEKNEAILGSAKKKTEWVISHASEIKGVNPEFVRRLVTWADLINRELTRVQDFKSKPPLERFEFKEHTNFMNQLSNFINALDQLKIESTKDSHPQSIYHA